MTSINASTKYHKTTFKKFINVPAFKLGILDKINNKCPSSRNNLSYRNTIYYECGRQFASTPNFYLKTNKKTINIAKMIDMYEFQKFYHYDWLPMMTALNKK